MSVEVDADAKTAGAGGAVPAAVPVHETAEDKDFEERDDRVEYQFDYRELCTPHMKNNLYRTYFEWWVKCAAEYERTPPHAGYAALDRLVARVNRVNLLES